MRFRTLVACTAAAGGFLAITAFTSVRVYSYEEVRDQRIYSNNLWNTFLWLSSEKIGPGKVRTDLQATLLDWNVKLPSEFDAPEAKVKHSFSYDQSNFYLTIKTKRPREIGKAVMAQLSAKNRTWREMMNSFEVTNWRERSAAGAEHFRLNARKLSGDEWQIDVSIMSALNEKPAGIR